MRSLKDKKGAFELSMTTVVVIVLAMMMLILGLTLVRTIFAGAKYNVEQINEKVRGQINKLFVEEEQRSAIYLAGSSAEVEQGESFNIAFAIRNVGSTGSFSYNTRLISKSCVRDDPMKWFILPPQASGITVPDGQLYHDLLSLKPEQTSELCTAKFVIEVMKDGQAYDVPFFIVETKAKGIF